MDTNSSRHPWVTRLPYSFLCGILAACLLMVPALSGSSPQAFAATSAEKQAELDEAFARLDSLQTEINQLAADYDAAVIAHAEAEARMLDAQAREEAARARIAELQAQLGDRASKMYRNGNGSYLDVLFGAQSFIDFITAMDLINRVNEQDARLVLETKTVRAEAEAARIEFTEQEQLAREKQEQIATLKRDRQTTELAMQGEIGSLEAELVEILLQEEIAREAAELAAANRGVGSYGTVTDEQMARVTALNLQYPFSSRQTISSGFGWRDFDNSFHLGTDFAAPGGTPILAIANGTVAAAGWHNLMGNYVIISHGSGVRSIYMHASGLNCEAGQPVVAGDVISYVGTTGNSTGNHLHLQIEVDLIAVNPMLFF
ncbi:MAG: peptidoglycan DD-metalloendopeptidase family protein [Coriobacteriales bacterium]|jgi:murein DD-endopeptidase MepM/ murein hydrolase activator NlpD|nr:peptidoglycan DD-metalloendopeptidase family protein [Coriobacteriales bacterium]